MGSRIFETMTSLKMYMYLPTYGKSENENMQNHALNFANFGAHISMIKNTIIIYSMMK